LDNATTAMTGHQPTPQVGIRADGSQGHKVLLPDLIRAAGVDHLQEIDPYDLDAFTAALKEADDFIRSPEGGVAVLIAKHPCIVDKRARSTQRIYAMEIEEACIGCRKCITDFECPALRFVEGEKRVEIDANLCIGCGVCRHVCPVGAIVAQEGGRA
jgi:indolepyruvate ferredoxin oxidoreductase alpha subunit